MVLKEYFKDNELSCKCGCGKMPSERVVELLYSLRILFDLPIKINSAARCESYNQSLKGAMTSTHVKGTAFDLASTNQHMFNEHRLLKLALQVGFNGIGISNNQFLHVDIRNNDLIWTY